MARARFHHDRGFVVGALDIPMPGCPGRLTVSAVGEDKADALHRAALIAERITSDPILSALLPPQAKAAIMAAKGLGIAAKRGSHALRGLLSHIRGPGAQRLAKVLHDDAATQEGHPDVSGLWDIAKKAARYGTPAGLLYTAAKKLRRKKKRKPEAERPEPPEPESDEGAEPDDASELEAED